MDFLFCILSLPVATVIRLVREQGMEGSLANLYHSVENLNETYIKSGQSKDTLLKPMLPANSFASSVPLLQLNGTNHSKKFYSCSYFNLKCYTYVSEDPKAICPGCGRNMTGIMTYVASPSKEKPFKEGGFVKKAATYMVMDDLEVKPMSTISSITFLKDMFNVNKLNGLEEKVVNLTMTDAVMLLKVSLESDNVLTDVFLTNKRRKTN